MCEILVSLKVWDIVQMTVNRLIGIHTFVKL